MDKLEALKNPIKPHEIHWRIQSARNGKTTVVPYLTNRCVMERFDEEFGALGWKNEFVEWRGKGVKCGISARHEHSGEWITKFDGADETNIESTKGGFSDSMKRAAVQWGLGRDLYDYPMIQIQGEHKYLSRQHESELNQIAENISTGQAVSDYVLIGASTPPKKQTAPPTAPPKTVIKDGSNEYMAIVDWIVNGKVNKDGELVYGTLEKAKKTYSISEDVENSLKQKIQSLAELS